MTPPNSSQSDTEQRYKLVAALTDRHCRFVVRSFREASEDEVSVADLATAFARENDEDEDEAALHLHHSALPRLNNLGVVDYDVRNKAVRYHGHPELEGLLDVLDSESESIVKVL